MNKKPTLEEILNQNEPQQIYFLWETDRWGNFELHGQVPKDYVIEHSNLYKNSYGERELMQGTLTEFLDAYLKHKFK